MSTTLSLTVRQPAAAPLHWADMNLREQQQACQDLGMPGFRAQQLNHQFYQRLQSDPLKMTDIPGAVREELKTRFFPVLGTPVTQQKCDKGSTVKTLWSLVDGSRVESVLMGYSDRATLCVSSQAGCAMGCPFCATGQQGLQRNLSTAEILEQVRWAAVTALQEFGPHRPLSNIVFMGMGEPLANYSRVAAALHKITSPNGFGISARSVTVSTVGLVPGIEKLTQESIPCTLAISLHAPDDALRNTLVPMNQQYSIDRVLEAGKKYSEQTGRRITIEYALMREINDQQWRAELLGQRLRAQLGHLVHVNLIPLNETPMSPWKPSTHKATKNFIQNVKRAGISCTLRDTRGDEIAAACGQLAGTVKNLRSN